MGDKGLEQRILKHLSSKAKKCEAVNKLVQVLREQKKSLNHCLYRMEKQSKVVKVQATPPVWGLPDNSFTTNSLCTTGRNTRSHEKKGSSDAIVSEDISEKVHQFLMRKGSPAKTIEIAKGVGLSRSSHVNPILYSMEENGLIERRKGKILTWSIVQGTNVSLAPVTDMTQAGPSFAHKDAKNSNTIPEFQETSLFRTNMSLDSNDTELLQGSVGLPKDGESLDEGLNENLIMPRQLFGLDNGGIGIKAEHSLDGDSDMEGLDESQGLVDTNERMNRLKDPFIGENETRNQSERTKTNKISDDNGFQHGHMTHTSDASNYSSQCLSYSNGNQTSESISLEVKREPGSGFTSGHDGVANSYSDPYTSYSVDMKRTTWNRNSSSSSPPISQKDTPTFVDEMLEMEENQAGYSHNQNKDEIDKDPSRSVSLVQEDMENSDKILKVLALLPGMAQFVLVKKTQLSQEETEKALEKCLALGFVSGCSKLWKITPEGIDYIETKLGESENDQEIPELNVRNPPRKGQKFAGPPPSPRALLENHTMRGTDIRPQTQNQTRPDRDRSPLQSFSQSRTQGGLSNRSRSGSYGFTQPSSMQFETESPSLSEVSQSRAFLNNAVKATSQGSVHLEMCKSGSGANSGLWDTVSNATPKQSVSLLQHISINSNNLVSYPDPNRQNTKSGTDKPSPVAEPSPIPSKYADYPNKSTSEQVLSSIRSQKGATGSFMDDQKSSSSFTLPPNPMEILARNMKKTGISPPTTPLSSPSSTGQTVVPHKLPDPRLLFGLSAGNQSGSSPSVLPKPPFLSNAGSLNLGSFGYSQIGGQSKGLSTQSEFRSLPASVNKPGGTESVVGYNSLALSNESFNALNKNPVSALMEYAQSRKMNARVEVVGRKGAAHRPTFTMAAFVGNRRFPVVTCNNKKDGRKEACDIALRQLIAEGQFQAESSSEVSGSKPQTSLECMTHFDKVAALTHRGFTALVSQITAESFAGRKVIAGLVMKRSEEDTGILISLGTGNRCITGQQLSLQGNTVNDSHAEIITRRGFIRFLYKQLLEYDPAKHNPLFEKSRTGKLQIRPKITFHLYISTAPCGDGALFSPRDAESSKVPPDTRIRPPHEPVFSSNVQGLLRTKVEGGEGTIPIEAGFKCQTFDGIQRGERLRTMSCTDKVCRWNVVGMQGALLSHFIEPVYLDSLTLGLLYDHGHLSRAVCCRVGRGPTNVDDLLPANYKLNHPWLGRVTACDPPREVQKTKALSVNWSFGDTAPEVTDGTTGLCNTSVENGFFSRCSKRNLFTSFKAVCEKFGRQDLLSAETYRDVKLMATDFQTAREAMLTKFKENKYGPWVSKPVEEEMFGWEKSK